MSKSLRIRIWWNFNFNIFIWMTFYMDDTAKIKVGILHNWFLHTFFAAVNTKMLSNYSKLCVSRRDFPISSMTSAKLQVNRANKKVVFLNITIFLQKRKFSKTFSYVYENQKATTETQKSKHKKCLIKKLKKN